MGIAEFGSLGDSRAARVGEAEDFGDFIEGFADGVILGLPDEVVVAVGAEVDELGVAAGDDEGEEGEIGLR